MTGRLVLSSNHPIFPASSLLKGNQAIAHKAAMIGRNQISASTISQAELYFGAYNSHQGQNNLEVIRRLTKTIPIRPFDEEAAQQFGRLRATLKQQGQILLDADLMIAGLALAYDLTLVTNNTTHFVRISKLSLENWTNP